MFRAGGRRAAARVLTRPPFLRRHLHRPQVPVHRQCVDPRPHPLRCAPLRMTVRRDSACHLAEQPEPQSSQSARPPGRRAAGGRTRRDSNALLHAWSSGVADARWTGTRTGTVKSTKMNKTLIVRRNYLHFIKKYQRCARPCRLVPRGCHQPWFITRCCRCTRFGLWLQPFRLDGWLCTRFEPTAPTSRQVRQK